MIRRIVIAVGAVTVAAGFALVGVSRAHNERGATADRADARTAPAYSARTFAPAMRATPVPGLPTAPSIALRSDFPEPGEADATYRMRRERAAAYRAFAATIDVATERALRQAIFDLQLEFRARREERFRDPSDYGTREELRAWRADGYRRLREILDRDALQRFVREVGDPVMVGWARMFAAE